MRNIYWVSPYVFCFMSVIISSSSYQSPKLFTLTYYSFMENQRGLAELQLRKGSHLLLFPLPFQGHINPLFQLAEILHAKGFSITIIHTNFNAPKSENYPHFNFRSISIGLTDSEVSMTNVGKLISDINVKCVEPFRFALSELLADTTQAPIACLIPDSLLHFTRAVADSFELPQIVLRAGGISCFLAYATFPLLLEKGYLPIQDSRLEEPIPELPPLRVKDLPVLDACNLEGLCELLKMMIQETKASSGLIWNSFEELEEPALATLRKMLSIPFFPVGPFHKYFPASSSSLITQDKGCISWLDKQKLNSVIYVSFGSIAQMDEKQFLEIAWALANSKHPFLWVIRPGLIPGSKWPESLPEGFLEMLDGRGHIVNWAPQQEVLTHPAAGAFWTHNGWNSTMESISEGVPMICMPFFTDQLLNARYVTHVWKVGLPVEIGWKRERIEGVINKLMEEKEGKDIRKRMLQLKENANTCLRPGGSSHECLKKLANLISSF